MTSIILYDAEILAGEKSQINMWNDLDGVPMQVIQIGAMEIALDETLTVLNSFNRIVIPRDAKGNVLTLPQYIIDLTSITQARMEAEGQTLKKTARQFAAFTKGRNIFSWGRQLDSSSLILSLFHERLYDEIALFDPRRFRDLRPILAKAGVPADLMPQNAEPGKPVPREDIINSGRLAEFLGLDLDNHVPHDALADVASLHASLKSLWLTGKITATDFV